MVSLGYSKTRLVPTTTATRAKMVRNSCQYECHTEAIVHHNNNRDTICSVKCISASFFTPAMAAGGWFHSVQRGLLACSMHGDSSFENAYEYTIYSDTPIAIVEVKKMCE